MLDLALSFYAYTRLLREQFQLSCPLRCLTLLTLPCLPRVLDVLIYVVAEMTARTEASQVLTPDIMLIVFIAGASIGVRCSQVRDSEKYVSTCAPTRKRCALGDTAPLAFPPGDSPDRQRHLLPARRIALQVHYTTSRKRF